MIMMDGMAFMRSSTSRSISASAAERTLLLSALAKFMGVLDTRENDAQTVLRKSELWDEITRHFNTYTTTPRSRQQIQTLYKNMKAKARRYEARLAEMANGIPPPDPDPISEMLLELLHQQLRNQQQQLRNLVAKESNGMAPNFDLPIPPQQYNSYINPEQMMQVSLREGAADDMDLKSENGDDEHAEPPDHDSDNSMSHPFPEIPQISELKDSSESSSNPKSFETIVSSPTSEAPQTSISDNSKETLHLSTSQTNAPPNMSENDSHGQHPMVGSPSQPSPAIQPFQFGLNDRASSLTPNTLTNPNSIFSQARSSTNTSDFLAALRGLNPLEDLNLKKNQGDAKPGIMPPLAKRPRQENFTRNCVPSGIQRLSCCCPEVHTKMLSMAQEEHQLRMALLKKEMEQKDKEHAAKMRNIMLEEAEMRLRTEKLKETMSQSTEEYTGQEAPNTASQNGSDVQNGLLYDFN